MKSIQFKIVLYLQVTMIWSWSPGFSAPNFCWKAFGGISKASGSCGRGMQTLKGILPWENSSVDRTSTINTSPSPSSTRVSSSSNVTAAMWILLCQVPKRYLSWLAGNGLQDWLIWWSEEEKTMFFSFFFKPLTPFLMAFKCTSCQEYSQKPVEQGCDRG